MKKLFVLTAVLIGFTSIAQDNENKTESELLIGEESVPAADKDKSEYIYETFGGVRVMYNHSVETLPKGNMEFVVSHKFGNILTQDAAGKITPNVNEWFGFDNLADVRLAFEFGILDNLDIGLGRSKGIGVTRSVVDGYAKYRILQQKKTGMPISLTFVSSLGLPYVKKSSDSTSVASYPTFLHRLIFTNQLLVAKKFGERFSVQLNFGYNHRNYVDWNDNNGNWFVGTSGRLRMTKNIGVIWEYNHLLNRSKSFEYYNPLTIGIEILTGGHSFVMGYSNARAMNENLFIPNTTSNWLDGEFRLGFSFTRRFKL